MAFDTDIFALFATGIRPTADMTRSALTSILQGDANDAQIGAFLLGLETLGLTALEIGAGTEVMRAHMTPVSVPTGAIDIVGTGGTGLHTLSISTATAIVCAGAGVKVAKHGNRAASSLTGTADTLSQLGVELAISPEKAADCVAKAGIGFLFAPNHHPAMRYVGPARKALKIRTLFNVLGPLCNPAGVKRQLLGVSQDKLRRPIADALKALSAKHIWVVHGSDGLDEITTTGPSFVTEVKDGKISEFEIHPKDYGIQLSSIEDIRGGEPAHNASALTSLLDGTEGPYRDIVLLNAAAALCVSGKVRNLHIGLDIARTSIDSGAAKATLAKLVEVSNG